VIWKILFLWGPAATCVAGLLAFAAFHAWPLGPVGAFFGRQPNYLPGYQEAALLLALPLWYLVGFGAAWAARLPAAAWTRPIAGVAAAVALVGLSFMGLLGGALSGSRDSGGIGLWPIRALSSFAQRRATPLRRAHYVARLDDPDPGTRALAGSGAYLEARRGAKGDGAATFQVGLARALRSGDPGIRHEVAQALEECYPLARPALLEVVARLADAPDDGRVEAAGLLGTVGWYGQPEPELRAALLAAAEGDRVEAVREAAVRALLRVDRENAGAAALLERRAASGDAFAARMLADVPGHGRSAAAAFRQRLADPDPARREAWTLALEGVSLAPPLLDPRACAVAALVDRDPRVRRAGIEVLREDHAEDRAVRRVLTTALADPDHGVRFDAVRALERAYLDEGPRLPPETLGALLAALEDPELLAPAAAVLGRRAPDDPAVTRAAVAALRAATTRETAWTVQQLLDGRPLDAAQLREVAALVDRGRPEVVGSALYVLEERLLSDPTVQLGLARAVVTRDEPGVRWQAARVLASAPHPLAPEATAALEQAIAAAPASPAAEHARRALDAER
jgi:hypothetical protein